MLFPTCYHTEFGHCESNRVVTCRGPKIFLGMLDAGSDPLGCGVADPLETCFSTTCITMPNLVILGQTMIVINGDPA